MNNKLATYLIIVVMFLLLIMWANNTHADNFNEYFQEEVEYVVAYGKPFPEWTIFKCIDGKLWKSRVRVRDYMGNGVRCEFKKMTRQEYEDLNNVTRTF